MAGNNEDQGVEPDAIKIICQEHCQKEGVNLYENGQHVGDKYDSGNSEPTFKPNIGCNVQRKALYGAETITGKTLDARKKIDLVKRYLDDLIESIESDLDHNCFNVKGDPTDVCNSCILKRQLSFERDRLEIAKSDLEVFKDEQ